MVEDDALELLAYASAAKAPMSAPALFSLLAKARENNRRNGLTGMLLYNDGYFLQVMEGAPDMIDQTIERLERDDRHKGMVVILRRAVPERLFANWSMGFATAQETGEAAFQFDNAHVQALRAADLCEDLARLVRNFYQTPQAYETGMLMAARFAPAKDLAGQNTPSERAAL